MVTFPWKQFRPLPWRASKLSAPKIWIIWHYISPEKLCRNFTLLRTMRRFFKRLETAVNRTEKHFDMSLSTKTLRFSFFEALTLIVFQPNMSSPSSLVLLYCMGRPELWLIKSISWPTAMLNFRHIARILAVTNMKCRLKCPKFLAMTSSYGLLIELALLVECFTPGQKCIACIKCMVKFLEKRRPVVQNCKG